MLKIESICEVCSQHYIVVSTDEVKPSYCPFCSSPISFDDEEIHEEDEE